MKIVFERYCRFLKILKIWSMILSLLEIMLDCAISRHILKDNYIKTDINIVYDYYWSNLYENINFDKLIKINLLSVQLLFESNRKEHIIHVARMYIEIQKLPIDCNIWSCLRADAGPCTSSTRSPRPKNVWGRPRVPIYKSL